MEIVSKRLFIFLIFSLAYLVIPSEGYAKGICNAKPPADFSGMTDLTLKDAWINESENCDDEVPGYPSPNASLNQYSCEPYAPVRTEKSISGRTYKLCCCITAGKICAEKQYGACVKTAPVSPHYVQQDAKETALGLISTEPGPLVSDIVSVISGVIGGISLLMLLYGSFKLITSGGNPDAVYGAKSTITAAITGLVIIILATIILGMAGVNILGLPGWEWRGTELVTP